MITVVVDEHNLICTALQLVVKSIDTEAELDRMLREGCPADLLDDLRQRKVRDLLLVSKRLRSMTIHLSIDEVRGELHRVDRIREDQELFEYFIVNGASRNMICEMWKRTREDVASVRKSLLPAGGASPGRTPLPKDPAERESVHQAWDEIRKEDPGASYRRNLYQLHQRFPAYSIDTLVCTLDEFKGTDRPRAQSSPKNAALPPIAPGSTSPFQQS